MARALVWFRRDLRMQDNPALQQACAHTREGVVGLFLLTPGQWRAHADAGSKVDFWLRNLRDLSQNLATVNIPLLLVRCETFADCPAAVLKLAQKHRCDTVFVNREYEVNERKRDRETATLLSAHGIGFRESHDRVVVPPAEIQTGDGRFYSVYTPYRRVWDSLFAEYLIVGQAPPPQPALGIPSSRIPASLAGFEKFSASVQDWPAGEGQAQQRLQNFSRLIANYGNDRDLPAVAGTSQLSPYLAAGVISARQCLAAALASAGPQPARDSGAAVWISELTWRDFYTHVLVGFPRVSRGRPFKQKTTQIAWRRAKRDLQAWQEGRTGYPLVDAGMRQLNQTGWMHNRLRMVTAMFLTKNLLMDWRLGEKYFMENLIDGDLAANNGGWQWSASTGTDAVPYFRIFSPFSQSKRFDPEGIFIKRYCPELESVPPPMLHDEKKLAAAIAGTGYPKFIVDYRQSRQRALAEFKRIT